MVVPTQLFPSVAVMVYVPAGAVNLFPAIVPPVEVYVNVPVPPVADNVAEPEAPLHNADVGVALTIIAAG